MPEKHKGRLEQLLSVIDMRGLSETVTGLFVSKNVHPSDTLASPAPLAAVLLERLSRDTPRAKQELASVTRFIKGRVLVDLGAGTEASGYMFAKLCGASGYIAIEANHFSQLHQEIEKISRGKNAMPAIVLGEDMRSALDRLPEGFASLLACNIDASVLFAVGESGTQILNEKITRTLDTGGAFLSYGSALTGSNLNEVLLSGDSNTQLRAHTKSKS